MTTDPHLVTDITRLESLYGDVRSGAMTKEQAELHPVYQALIAASPFCAFATVGPDGTDCTPRGDGPGFVRVIDEHTLEMADRKGNNRLDSMRNIVVDGRVQASSRTRSRTSSWTWRALTPTTNRNSETTCSNRRVGPRTRRRSGTAAHGEPRTTVRPHRVSS